MEEKKEAGRPLLEIDQKIFENLCSIQCTENEIISVLGVSQDTLIRWCKRTYKDENGKGMTFQQVYPKFKDSGKVSLRRKQWKLADKSSAMAIFLGKNILGQADTSVVVNTDLQEDDPITKSIKESFGE